MDHAHDHGDAITAHGHGHDRCGPRRMRPRASIVPSPSASGSTSRSCSSRSVFGVRTNSLALISDAGHNLGDVLGLVLAWAGTVLARRGPTPRRTYGMRRFSILAAIANAGTPAHRRRRDHRRGGGSIPPSRPRRGRRRIDRGGRRDRHQPRYRPRLHARPSARPQHPRRVPPHARRRRCLRGRRHRRSAHQRHGLALDRSGHLAPARRIDPVEHVGAREGLREPRPGRGARRHRPARGGCGAPRTGGRRRGARSPHLGDEHHDVALTAHLIRPCHGGEDALLAAATRLLRDRFGIAHATLQVEQGLAIHPCDLAAPGSV